MELVFPLGKTGGAVLTGERAVFPAGEKQPLSLCLWLKAAVSTATARIISYFYKDIVIFVSRTYEGRWERNRGMHYHTPQ